MNEGSVLRDIFKKKEFRIAISLAINRDEINETLFFGAGKPWSGRFPEDPYDAGPPTYIDYDPQKANQLLDEIGLTERNEEGYRLRPDGKVLEVVIDTMGDAEGEMGGQAVDVLSLTKAYWKEGWS